METTQGIVIVTGASGFIGSAVAERLAEQFQIVNLDKNEPSRSHSRIEFVKTDLASDESVRRSLEHVRYKYGDWITSVIYLAGDAELAEEPNRLYRDHVVHDTDQLLHDLQRFRVEQFVFSSTIFVYAPTEPGHPIHERSPVAPKWDFLRSKISTGRLIRERRGDMQTAVLRIAVVYDDQCHSMALAGQIQRIFERKLLSRVFPGDTSHGQAYIHLEDLVDALARIVDRRWILPSELTLILGEPKTLSHQELQNVLGRLIHDEDWQTKEIPKSLAKTNNWIDEQLACGEQPHIKPWLIDSVDDHYELDISLAHKLLDWNPHRSLGDTLSKMVSALKSDPVGWYHTNKLEVPPWLEENFDSAAGNTSACIA
jgi:nucleoside-diphosphate-sugar epimerase